MGLLDSPPLRPADLQRAAQREASYSSGTFDYIPVANPTDFAAVICTSEDRVGYVKRISISAIADTAGSCVILLQKSANGGGGTPTILPSAKHDVNDYSAGLALQTFGANRSSNGNGVSTNRPIIRSARLKIGTAAVPEDTLVWEFNTRESKGLMIRSLVEWYVLNLNAQTLPSNTKLAFDVEWSDAIVRRVILPGDSTRSNANFLFDTLGKYPRINSICNVRNHGSNGARLYDYRNNVNSPPYPISATVSALPQNYSQLRDKILLCYGLNDVRQGVDHTGSNITQSYLVSLLQSTVDYLKANCPKADIILQGPNPLTTDGNGSSFVILAGAWAGMSLPVAAQAITDLLYNTYEAMRGYTGVKDVIQIQDIPEFGRTCKTVAASGLHTDILHPNSAGQYLIANQIAPYILAD